MEERVQELANTGVDNGEKSDEAAGMPRTLKRVVYVDRPTPSTYRSRIATAPRKNEKGRR